MGVNDWIDAEQCAERAQRLAEAQQWVEALRELDTAIAINPHIAEWHTHRAYLLDELERYGEAAEAYQHSLLLEPDNPEVLLLLGVELSRTGDYERALRTFEELARLDPDSEPAFCHRIAIYAELGRHEKAEEMFYRAQQLNEKCPHCFFHIGASLGDRGHFDKAQSCWEKVLEIDPEYIGVNQRLAQLHRLEERPVEARSALLAEYRIDPGNTDILMELAELSLEQDEIVAAATKYAQVIELDPEHGPAHLAMGKLFLRQGRPSDALGHLERGELLDEEIAADASLHAAEALLYLERVDDAQRRLLALKSDSRRDGRVQMLLGHCFLARRQLPRAAECYRRVISREAGNPLAHHNLGVCHLFQGEHSAGLASMLRALECKPDFVPAMHRAALALMQLARWDEARAMLRQASTVDSGNADVKRLMRNFNRLRLRLTFQRILRRLKLSRK